MKRKNRVIFSPLFCLTAVMLLVAATCQNSAQAVTVTPSSWASIHDGPIDGTADGFNTEPGRLAGMVSGLSPEQAYKDVVVVEYDLSPFAGEPLAQVSLDFEVQAYDLSNPQLRAFDVFSYSGDGSAELSDLAVGASYVDTVGYTIGSTGSFSIDILSEAQAIIDGAGDFLGIRIEPIGSRNPASLITAAPVLNVATTVSPIPEPATILVLGLGAAVLMRKK